MSGVQQAETVNEIPPAGKVGDPPVLIHEPEGKWPCLACGSVNSPAVVGDGDEQRLEVTDECWNCKEPRRQTLEELGITHKTIRALAGGLQEQAGNAAGVEAVERPLSEEGPKAEVTSSKPAQPGLTFPAAFDADAAFLAIERQYGVVDAAKAEYEDLKEQASEAKKTWERAVETLGKLIQLHADRKHGVERQPFLKEVSDGASCAVSSAMGAPCPACASQRAKGGESDVNDPLHPAHPQHEAIAKSLLVKDAQDLATRLQGKHFYMDAAAIMLLPIDELQTLQRYSVQNGVVPPELLVSAHIAAAAGTDRQECKTCGLVLIDAKQIDLGASFYPEHAAVGLDCEGRPDEQPKAEARAPKSHAKKNKTRKAAPEQEAAAQVNEGKKRAKKEPKAKKVKARK